MQGKKLTERGLSLSPPSDAPMQTIQTTLPATLGTVEGLLSLVFRFLVRLQVVASGEGRIAEVTEKPLLTLLRLLLVRMRQPTDAGWG